MDFYKDVTITSKGQLTLPVRIRRALKLGVKRKVRVAVTQGGGVTLRPLADAMSFHGVLKGGKPYDAHEKRKARTAMARRGSRKAKP